MNSRRSASYHSFQYLESPLRRRLRYVLCFNPEEATRQQAHRQYLLKELTAELAAMGDAAQDVQSKRVAELRSSRRWGKYDNLSTSSY